MERARVGSIVASILASGLASGLVACGRDAMAPELVVVGLVDEEGAPLEGKIKAPAIDVFNARPQHLRVRVRNSGDVPLKPISFSLSVACTKDQFFETFASEPRPNLIEARRVLCSAEREELVTSIPLRTAGEVIHTLQPLPRATMDAVKDQLDDGVDFSFTGVILAVQVDAVAPDGTVARSPVTKVKFDVCRVCP